MLRHADGWVTVFAHAKAHLDIGFGGVGDCIGQFVGARLIFLVGPYASFLVGIHEQFIFIPGDFILTHPKWRDFYLVLRRFISFVGRLGIRAAHNKFSARDWHHGKDDLRTRNGVGIRAHLTFIGQSSRGGNLLMNIRDRDIIIVRKGG